MIEYLIKSGLAVSAIYLLYHLFMQNNIDFRWLRFYFITSILASILFPLFKHIPFFQQQALVTIPLNYIPDFVYTEDTSIVVHHHTFWTAINIIQSVYILGFIFFAFKSLIGLFHLFSLIIKYGVSKHDGNKYVLIPEFQSSFTCFNLIFIDPVQLNEVNKEAVLRHENVHIHQHHWVDLFLLEIITIFQWFNPFVFKLSASVKELHEFLADKGAIGNDSPIEYQHLIISQVCGLDSYNFVNGFRSSLTKKRILMITNNKRNKRWFAAFAILVVAIIFTDTLSRVNIAQQPQQKKQNVTVGKAESTNNSIKSSPPKKSEYNEGKQGFIAVEENATFQGGDLASFRTWVQKNSKYPADAMKDKTEGKVTVKFTINTIGKVSDIKILRSLSNSIDNEIIRVLNTSPDWKPGLQKGKAVNQQFVIPVNFKIKI